MMSKANDTANDAANIIRENVCEQKAGVSSDNKKNIQQNLIGRFVYSGAVQTFITICIILNAIQLGLETSAWWNIHLRDISKTVDHIFIWIFAAEVVLKILSDKFRFFKTGWNIFDFLVVAISFFPGNGTFSILRAFRVFRAFRILNKFRQLRVITESLFASIPSIGWICLLLSIWFYIGSVIATNLFNGKFPEWFGSIPRSMYSLFQIMTLESWSMGIVRPVMREFPFAWLLFIPFIIFATYMVMNLFIGVLVSAISDIRDSCNGNDSGPAEMDDNRLKTELLTELKTIREELREIKKENAELREKLDLLKK